MKKQSKSKGLIFVISGPSGSGKTTLAHSLTKDKKLKKVLVKAVSLTTRPKRTGEREGKDYFFISEQGFRARRRQRKILEWTKYSGYYYATPKDFLDCQIRRQKNLVLCLDVRGALAIKRLYPRNAVTIFIRPPSLEELRLRIQKRCRKTHTEEIKRRLKIASQELSASRRYDYRLINKDLAKTVNKLKKIILKELPKI